MDGIHREIAEKLEQRKQSTRQGIESNYWRPIDTNDGLDELMAESKKAVNDKTAFNKMKAIADLLNKYNWSQKTNLVIEIIFPLGLGFFAVVLAAWVSFVK